MSAPGEHGYVLGAWYERRRAASEGRDGLARELLDALKLFTSPSMGSSNARGETGIAWQSSDGPTANERLAIGRAAVAKAELAGLLDKPAAQPVVVTYRCEGCGETGFAAPGEHQATDEDGEGYPVAVRCGPITAVTAAHPAPDPLRSPGDDRESLNAVARHLTEIPR